MKSSYIGISLALCCGCLGQQAKAKKFPGLVSLWNKPASAITSLFGKPESDEPFPSYSTEYGKDPSSRRLVFLNLAGAKAVVFVLVNGRVRGVEAVFKGQVKPELVKGLLGVPHQVTLVKISESHGGALDIHLFGSDYGLFPDWPTNRQTTISTLPDGIEKDAWHATYRAKGGDAFLSFY